MKNRKCIVFDFTKGKRVDTAYYHYKNGGLDLDLKIEVMSPDSVYGSNVIEFRMPDNKIKNNTCKNKTEEPFFTA